MGLRERAVEEELGMIPCPECGKAMKPSDIPGFPRLRCPECAKRWAKEKWGIL